MAALALAYSIIAIVGFLVDRAYGARSRASTREMLASLAASHAKEIAAHVRERVADARLTGMRDAAQHALDPALPAGFRAAESARLRQALGFAAATHDLRHLIVFDPQMRPVAQDPNPPHPMEPLHAMLQQVIGARRARIVRVREEPDSSLELSVVAPVFADRDSTRELWGAVYSAIDPEFSLLPSLARSRTGGASIESTLLQREGDSIAVFFDDIARRRQRMRVRRFAAADTSFMVAKAMRISSGPLTGSDARGNRVIAHAERVPGTDWISVARVETSEARRRILVARAVIVAVCVLLALITALVGRNLLLEQQRDVNELRWQAGRKALRVVQTSRDGFVTCDDEGRILEVNDAMSAMSGYSRGELLQMTMRDLREDRAAGAVETTLDRIRTHDSTSYVTRWRRKDGVPVSIDVSTRYLTEDGRGIVVAFIRDISKQIENQERLERFNRLYLLLSQASEAMFASRTPDEAFEQICRFAGDTTDFSLAWVGLVDDVTQTLRPVALHGPARRVIEDGALVREPGGTVNEGLASRCVRELAPVAENDLASGTETTGWRAEARALGVGSAAAFPVIEGGRVVAALGLLAKPAGFFVPEVVGVVAQIARSLGLVLHAQHALERQLHEQERFRLFFESSPLPMVVRDRQTLRTLQLNRAFTTITGWTLEDFPDLPTSLRKFFPDPAYRAEVEASWRASQAALDAGAESVQTPLLQMICKDGRVRRMYAIIATVQEHLLLGWVDLTALHESQALLSESQDIARLRSWEYDFGTDTVRFGETALDAPGHPHVERGLRWFYADMLPEDRDLARTRWAEAVRDRTPIDLTSRHIASDGSVVYRRARVRIEYDTASAPRRAVGSSQDVTNETLASQELEKHRHNLEQLVAARTAALTKAYEQLEESQRRFSFAMEASSEGIWDWNLPTGQMTYSREYCSILGYESDGIPAAPDEWARRVHPDDRDRVMGEMYGLREHDESRTLEFRMCRKDGSYIWVETTGRTMARDAAGNATRVVGTLADLSDRHAQEDALRAAKEAADDANRAKSSFLAVMSHEIRTPLNGVIGMAEVLTQSQLPAREADEVQVIRNSATSLLALINDILDFSKIEAGRLELEMMDTDLADVVDGVMASLGEMAKGAQVDVSAFVSPAVPTHIVTDATRLRQIIYNLVGNAIKFSAGEGDRRGRVAVRVELADGAPRQLRIVVADNGIGIAEGDRGRLFTSYMQADTSTTRRFGGTGLGLAICKRLCELFDGAIGVQSTLGSGATFTVSIPFVPSADQPARTLPDIAGLRCIVVRHADDLGEADDLITCLSLREAVVTAAQSNGEALQRAATLPAPVVIIESGPGWTELVPGAEAGHIRRLRITHGSRRTPRVVTPNLVMLDRIALGERSVVRAVAVAAGRMAPDAVRDDDDATLALSCELPHVTAAEARRRGLLILVAEDDTTNQKVILRQLDLLGYAADVVSDGAEALTRWRAGAYALILSDLNMPVMDGYALTASVRSEEPEGSRIPIIALTANAQRGEELRAKAIGMDAYLTKPIRLLDLKQALVAFMPRREEVSGAEELTNSSKPADVAAERTPRRVVDIEVLKGFVGDDVSVISDLLSEFRGAARRARGELRDARRGHDRQAVAGIAHRLKSAARALGALSLGEQCGEMERRAKQDDIDPTLDQALDAIDAELGEVDEEIGKMLAP